MPWQYKSKSTGVPARDVADDKISPQDDMPLSLAKLDSKLDPDNPVNWPKSKKWLLTVFACFMAFMIGINALSISSAAKAINQQFGVSDEHFPNSYWTVTSWNVGATVAPVIGLPLMENFGVRPIYLSSFALFFVFVIPQAVATNYATLIVTRFFAGAFGSVVMNAIANICGDIWIGLENTLPLFFFTYFYLFGFTLGPVVGSAIAKYLDWRWIFYIQLILYAPLLPAAWFFIKETRASVILAAKRKALTDCSEAQSQVSEDITPTFMQLLYEGTVRPACFFCTEPVVFFFSLWSGLAVGNVFLATQSIGLTYGTNYGFGDVQSGFLEAALAIGETIGLFIMIFQGRIYSDSAKKNARHPGVPIPEARLQLSIPASFIGMAGGLFVYAWTSYSFVHWIGPTIGLGLVGVGIMVVVTCAVTYVMDAYGKYSGSAIAALASIENLLSGFLPLAAQRMYTNLGFQWASSTLAFFAIALSFAPVVLYIKGPTIRAGSRFMSS